ncbi:MAG: hypothetical protein ACRD3W_14185, partial [Terriglobales bacterium]
MPTPPDKKVPIASQSGTSIANQGGTPIASHSGTPIASQDGIPIANKNENRREESPAVPEESQSAPSWTGFVEGNKKHVWPRLVAEAIRVAKLPWGPSATGASQITMDKDGNITGIRHATEANREQMGMQIMTAGYAGHAGTDPAAHDAARQAAIDAGADKPHGLMEYIGAGLLFASRSSFEQTALAKQRFQRAISSEAIKGAASYVQREPGNAYTNYLEARNGGRLPVSEQAWGVYQLLDESSPESGWNPTLDAATRTTVNSGNLITEAARGLASNPYVMALPISQKGLVIRFGSNYVAESVDAMNIPLGPNEDMLRRAYTGQVARSLSGHQVNALLEIANAADSQEHAVEDTKNTHLVQTVSGLFADPSVSRGERTALVQTVKTVGKALEHMPNDSGAVRPRAENLQSAASIVKTLHDYGVHHEQIHSHYSSAESITPAFIDATEIAAREFGGSAFPQRDFSSETVAAVRLMREAGHQPEQIGRSQIFAAKQSIAAGIPPTVENVQVIETLSRNHVRPEQIADIVAHANESGTQFVRAVDIASNVLPPAEVNAQNVVTVARMINDYCWAPGAIQDKYQIQTASALLNERVNPTREAVQRRIEQTVSAMPPPKQLITPGGTQVPPVASGF